MMGTSLLSIPWGLGQSGFLLGILLILLFGCLTFYTALRVLQSKDLIGNFMCTFSVHVSDFCVRSIASISSWR